MAEKEPSRVLIEPSSKVVETLRLAMLEIGLDELTRRTGSGLELLEKWINGREWVPLKVVKEACEIDRSRQDAPSYSKVLSECTAGAQFRISTVEEVEKPPASAVAEVPPAKAEISEERLEKPSSVVARREAPRQVAELALALFIVPLLGAAVGFLVADPTGAVIGTILSFAIAAAFDFLLLVLFQRKLRKV